MTAAPWTLGIIGGTGMLGRAIAHAVLKSDIIPPDRLWISNRSGRADGFEDHPGINLTTNNQDLAQACDVILLSVPPAMASDLGLHAPDRLILSVMAGVSVEKLAALTGSPRVIRAMSSPAAETGLAYSPWCAAPAVTSADRARTTALFGACGLTDEVQDEAHIEFFTAMTGPVPGFVAFFAEAMANHATSQGIPAAIADRAVRQLFLSAGTMMADGSPTPAEHVQQMIDYAGTTAAGLEYMRRSTIARDIARGLNAAITRTRSIG